jgi:predicted nucleotidyltransferase
VLELTVSEKHFVRRSWPLLGALRCALRTEANVRFALLFGSTATGDDTPDSDVDLLVDLREDSLESVLALRERLTEAVERPVDLLRLEDAERDPALLADLVMHGRVLVDRADRWPVLQARAPALRRRGRENDARRTAAALTGIDRLLSARR